MKGKNVRRFSFVLFLFVAAIFLIGCGSTPEASKRVPFVEGQEYTLKVLHTNDHHGALLPNGGLAGIAERSTFINQARNQDDNLLVLDAGDINAGPALSNYFKAMVDIRAYNMIGYDAVTMGNHEFDGDMLLLEEQIAFAEFPWLSANITRSNGKYLDEAYIIRDFDGFRVGIFGLTTLRTKVIASPDKSLIFKDEIETAKQMVDELRSKSCDVIILLGHLGTTLETAEQNTSIKLAEAVTGIDLIIDGHSHTYFDKPQYVNGTPIVSANEWGKFMGEGVFTIVNGSVTGFSWKPVAINTKDNIVFEADPAISAMIAPYKAEADALLDQVVGEATALFEQNGNLSRRHETALGNMVNDGAMWYFRDHLGKDVDFAFTNGGNIRAELRPGNITRGDLTTVLAFDNWAFLTTMNGKQLVSLMEFIASINQGAGGFAQVSKEIRYTIDYSSGKGVLKDLTIHGKPVDPNKEYTFVTNDYLMGGGDGYIALADNVGSYNTSITLRDAVIDYVIATKVLTPKLDGRITIIGQ